LTIQCLGCTVKHAATAQSILSEGWNPDQLVEAMGELRQAEKHSQAWPEISRGLREVRKLVETHLFFKPSEPPPAGEVEEVLRRVKRAVVEEVWSKPAVYCPTCRPPRRRRHRARHRGGGS